MAKELFVKRFKVGFKGTQKFNELVPAETSKQALGKYARQRGFFGKIPPQIILKRGR